MKKLILLCMLLNLLSFSATANVYKIQVFRLSDNKQLYGLHANDTNRANRLAAAMLVHNPPLTTLVNEDITAEITTRADVKTKRVDAHTFLKAYDCSTLSNDFMKALCRVRK